MEAIIYEKMREVESFKTSYCCLWQYTSVCILANGIFYAPYFLVTCGRSATTIFFHIIS